MAQTRSSRGYFSQGEPFYVQLLKLNPDGTSGYRSVQNWLNRLRRRGSRSSTHSCLSALGRLVKETGLDPDALVVLSPEDGARRVQGLCDGLNAKGGWQFARTSGFRLTAFFKANGLEVGKLLDLDYRGMERVEYVPSKDEVYRMADVSGLRDRAIILTLYGSGLRNSTLRALRSGDVKEQFEKDINPLRIHVTGELRRADPDACKEWVEYWTFLTGEPLEALKAYMRNRGPIRDEEPLFAPEGRNLTPEMRREPVSKSTLLRVVKNAARRAGLREWRAIRVHSLRKTFPSILDSGHHGGGQIAEDDKEYLMGHTLPGQKAPYHTSNVEVLASRYVKHDWDRHPLALTKEEVRTEVLGLLMGKLADADLAPVAERLGISPEEIRLLIKRLRPEVRRRERILLRLSRERKR